MNTTFKEEMKQIWENFPDKGLRDSWTDYYINALKVQRSPEETSTVEPFKKFYSIYFDEDQIECIIHYSQWIYYYDYYMRNYKWRLEFVDAFRDVKYDESTMNYEIEVFKQLAQTKSNELKEMMDEYDYKRYMRMYGIYNNEFDF